MKDIERKLTVDDLIVEYMAYRLRNGYEPSFSTTDFMNFLKFFQTQMPVSDFLDDRQDLFKKFFERKSQKHWWSYKDNQPVPHMDLTYCEDLDDYVLSANYDFCVFDESVLNPNYMRNKMYVIDRIRKITEIYMSGFSKKDIETEQDFDDHEMIVGKYIAAGIIKEIWLDDIENQIEMKRWPSQCRDINQYLFDIDLAEIINLPSKKTFLIRLFQELSKRIASLYHQDKKLQISSKKGFYLARENYDLVIQGYEPIFNKVFGPYKKTLCIDLTSFTFQESHEVGGSYEWDDDPLVKTTTSNIENDQVKKLIKNFENHN